jgi:5,10-methylene-tetrahydrofolate dehydrogenase/methenyl tetrahydrofolate cyclohydrolase
MMERIKFCQVFAKFLRQDIRRLSDDLRAYCVALRHAVVKVCCGPASAVYVGIKVRDCEEWGIRLHMSLLSPGARERISSETILRLNEGFTALDLSVQLPLPKHFNKYRLLGRSICHEHSRRGAAHHLDRHPHTRTHQPPSRRLYYRGCGLRGGQVTWFIRSCRYPATYIL